nr:hypothetical protein [Dechloromonas sp.]
MAEETQLKTVVFRCKACKHVFEATPGRVEAAPEDDDVHPWRYFRSCSQCGEEATQAHWARAAMKAWRKCTGPRTPEGKAKVRENLIGHPTPEEALRTRFNGMKHGLNAKVATYFPAKPDGYAFCATCNVDRIWCSEQPCCEKQTVNFMKHRAAFEQKNPKHLMGIYADFHAALMSTLSECLRQIIGDGVTLRTPKTYIGENDKVLIVKYYDQDGYEHVVHDVMAHPLFKPVSELITRMGISLSDLAMTPKQGEDEAATLGKLAQDGAAQESLAEFEERKVKALEDLSAMMARANAAKAQDPVLIEYQQQNGG